MKKKSYHLLSLKHASIDIFYPPLVKDIENQPELIDHKVLIEKIWTLIMKLFTSET